MKVGAALATTGEEDAESSVEALSDLRVATDSMGHDMIIYFPGVAWAESEEESEDEEDEEAA